MENIEARKEHSLAPHASMPLTFSAIAFYKEAIEIGRGIWIAL
jgi:hypothetical protein